jgi:hypothetical protein
MDSNNCEKNNTNENNLNHKIKLFNSTFPKINYYYKYKCISPRFDIITVNEESDKILIQKKIS